MDKIKILIADDSDQTREMVSRYIEMEGKFEVIGQAANGLEAIEFVKRNSPDIVLMDINMPGMTGLEATEAILDEFPNMIIIIMSVQKETEYLKKAMFSGAKEYIIKPFDMEVLSQTIESVYNKEASRIKIVQPTVLETKSGKVMSFFSSKGGVGKSVLSTNFCISLKETNPDSKILLMDSDLLFGDIAIINNLKPDAHIFDLIEFDDYNDLETAKTFIKDGPGGIDVLLSPPEPETSELIKPEHLEKTIKLYKKIYDFIIVDTSTNFSEYTLSVLDQSDEIFYITTPDILSVKNSKVGYNVLQSLKYDPDKILIVLNRQSSKDRMANSDIESIIGRKIDFILPDDTSGMKNALDFGKPILLENKFMKSKFIKSMKKFANHFKVGE